MSETAPILEARHVSLHFGGVRALADVTFAAIRGALLSIIGPNGAGKTTEKKPPNHRLPGSSDGDSSRTGCRIPSGY